MQTNRRVVCASLLGVGFLSAALLAFPARISSSQKVSPPPPFSGQRPEDNKQEGLPEHKPDPHALLKENQKNIKRDVDRLAELAEELKQEVDKTDSADVLSILLLKKAEEIEKLAKAIRNRARG
jgi:peptidoglycan hydrolase CwlO-like protein